MRTVTLGALLEQRGNQWGDAIETHVRIAQVWTGILGFGVQPVQVALMMKGMKMVRASINPSDRDSFDDDEGYGRIAQLIAGHRTTLADEPVPASEGPSVEDDPSEWPLLVPVVQLQPWGAPQLMPQDREGTPCDVCGVAVWGLVPAYLMDHGVMHRACGDELLKHARRS